MLTRLLLLPVLMFVASSVTMADEGIVTRPSVHSVATTVDRLETALSDKGFRIFARVDHAAGAESVGMGLAPTQLLIFGKPEAGTLLMSEARTVGIDLPMKFLVWEDADGQVTIGWNDPVWLAERHKIGTELPVLGNIGRALGNFAREAGQ